MSYLLPVSGRHLRFLQIRFYVAYELRYMCSSDSSSLESAILNFYFWLGRTVILMSHLNSVFEDLLNSVYSSMSEAKIEGRWQPR